MTGVCCVQLQLEHLLCPQSTVPVPVISTDVTLWLMLCWVALSKEISVLFFPENICFSQSIFSFFNSFFLPPYKKHHEWAMSCFSDQTFRKVQTLHRIGKSKNYLYMVEWMNERTHERMHEWMKECIHECMNEWIVHALLAENVQSRMRKRRFFTEINYVAT